MKKIQQIDGAIIDYPKTEPGFDKNLLNKIMREVFQEKKRTS